MAAQYARIGTPRQTAGGSYFAHLVELLLQLPERINFTHLERCGGQSVRAHARWFARPYSLRAPGHGRPGYAASATGREVAGSGRWLRAQERGPDLGPGSGMACAARRGLEVSLLTAVDVEAGCAYPLCARQPPGAVPSRRQTCGSATGRETPSMRQARHRAGSPPPKHRCPAECPRRPATIRSRRTAELFENWKGHSGWGRSPWRGQAIGADGTLSGPEHAATGTVRRP